MTVGNSSARIERRLPLIEGYAAEFYAWCQRRELRFQRCTGCGTWRHPPRPMCPHCGSLDWEWAATAGKGKVHCWTIVHQALDPAFSDDVPYAVVVVEMDEGPRLATWVTELAPSALVVDMPVEVWFDDITDAVTLPKFKPAR